MKRRSWLRIVDSSAVQMLCFGAGLIGGMVLLTFAPGLPWSGSARAMKDIDAQVSMASAAWYMVAITAASVIVGAASLYLIFRTLREAKRSADAAHSAVAAAERTTVQAYDMGKRQARAYLLVDQVTLAINFSGRLSMTMRITNSGQSPARTVSANVQLVASYIVRGEAFSPGPCDYRLILNGIKSGGDITASWQWNDAFDKITDRDGRHLFQFQFSGDLRYLDVFGDLWIEPFEFSRPNVLMSDTNTIELFRHPDNETMFYGAGNAVGEN